MRNPDTDADTTALLPGGQLQYNTCTTRVSKETNIVNIVENLHPKKTFSFVALCISKELPTLPFWNRRLVSGLDWSVEAVQRQPRSVQWDSRGRGSQGGGASAQESRNRLRSLLRRPFLHSRTLILLGEPHSMCRRVYMDATMSMLTGQRANKSPRPLEYCLKLLPEPSCSEAAIFSPFTPNYHPPLQKVLCCSICPFSQTDRETL